MTSQPTGKQGSTSGVDDGGARPPLGSAAVAVLFAVLVFGLLAVLHFGLHMLGAGTLGALLLFAAAGVAAGVLAYRHILKRCHVRALYRHQVAHHIALLDAANPPSGPMSSPMVEPASREMFDRIDAAARQLRLLREIEEGVHGLEALFDLHGKLVWISPSVARLTDHDQAACMAAADAIEFLVHESDRAYCRKMAMRIADGSEAEDFEMRLVRRDGEIRWVACHLRPLGRDDDDSRGMRLSAEDIHARKETEYKLLETVAELRRSQALREHYLSRSNDERMRLTALLNMIRLGILFLDRDHRVLYCNRAMLGIWGFSLDENLIGVRDTVLLRRMAQMLDDPESYLDHVHGRLGERENHEAYEFALADGRILTDATALVEGPDSTDIGRVWIFEDVTEARRTAQRLVQMAERDPLTDLFNRRRFHEELDRALANASRRGATVGLLMFDLDGFKPINDMYGHQAGDEVLVKLSRSVGALIRRDEFFCRLGGDEFAVLVPDVKGRTLPELARRVVECVAALSFRFDDTDVGLTASVGIALFPEHADDPERLVAAADQAMYQSKSAGRNRWSIATIQQACQNGGMRTDRAESNPASEE